MSNELIIANKEDLVNIADAIREKAGTTDSMALEAMADAIAAIEDAPIGGFVWYENRKYPTSVTYLSSDTQIPRYACYSNIDAGALYYQMTDFIMSDTISIIGDYVFYGCSNLSNIDTKNITEIGDYAFYKCLKLKNLDLSNVVSIGASAFYSNQSSVLTGELELPKVTSIGEYAFRQAGITSVYAPLLPSIKGYAFYSCSKLITADFPVVTSIAVYAFRGCSALISLILRSETMATLSNTNAFVSSGVESGTGYIYVPSALVESYKAATNWSTYATQFRALEDYTVDGSITGELDSNKI